MHVVLGAAEEEVREQAELPGCVLVGNPHWAEGMGSSLRAGLASLSPRTPPATALPGRRSVHPSAPLPRTTARPAPLRTR